MRIAYDSLVRDYLDSLHSKLRNFSVEPEFLATWVHDEDDHVSLFEVFAAAQSSGCRELTVVVGPAIARTLDEARLRALLAPLGNVALARGVDGSWDVSALISERLAAFRVAAPVVPAAKPVQARAADLVRAAAARMPGELHPAYRVALARLCSVPRFEEPPQAVPVQGLVVETREGSARLSITVGADGVVLAAAHSGATGDLRGLLDGLCALLRGRPFREGSDHAVIRLETSLRDPSVPAPAIGLVTPKNADPAFAIPEKMVRAAYREWAAKTAAKPGWNFWDDAPAAAWLALSSEEKLARAKAAVRDGLRELGASEAGVEVLEILHDCRVVLAATPETIKPAFAAQMMKLEGKVKAKLDRRLELQLESLEDRNRRAARTARTDKLV